MAEMLRVILVPLPGGETGVCARARAFGCSVATLDRVVCGYGGGSVRTNERIRRRLLELEAEALNAAGCDGVA